MNAKKFLAMLLAVIMVVSMFTACGKEDPKPTNPATPDTTGNGETNTDTEPADTEPEDTSVYGPVYDEWSTMTADELYQAALEEGGKVVVYATSSKMLKAEEKFEETYPGIDVEIMDMDQDEVLEKCELEANANNILGDVLQAKDANGSTFYDFFEEGYCTAYYPKDICEKIDADLLKYGYPLYASQSFWYYNTEAFPDGQPVNSWWQIIEKDEAGNQKFRLFTKEIGAETAYLSLFASFIVNSDAMAQSYKDTYGTDLEYTYDASAFDFAVPENNAGVEYLWRFSQMKMTFIGDGDELVAAVHNSTADDPALALASGGKIGNRDENGYNIAWVIGMTPYTGLENCEYMYVVNDCPHPAAARLFIYFITGGEDGKSGGLKPFSKEGNWPVRSDVEADWNPATLEECGAIEPDLESIYDEFNHAQKLWTYWLDQNPNM